MTAATLRERNCLWLAASHKCRPLVADGHGSKNSWTAVKPAVRFIPRGEIWPKPLVKLLEDKSDRYYLDDCLRHYDRTRRGLDELAAGSPGRTPIHPQFVAKLMDELASESAIFACDVGTPTIWASRYLRMNGKRRLLGSFLHGSMANALPQAIGAQAAMLGRQVVTLSGGGGIAMSLGDLLTLRQLNMPVKVVVFNNGSLGFVELEMKAAGWPSYGTNLVNPDFARLAESADIKGIGVEAPEDLRPALQTAFDHDGPMSRRRKGKPARAFDTSGDHSAGGFGVQFDHDTSGSQRERR
jgi:thiamine pyrophosphate-dependent acetolactate synthase large subunit-like protein